MGRSTHRHPTRWIGRRFGRCCGSLLAIAGLACSPIAEPTATLSTPAASTAQPAEPSRTIALPTLPFTKQTATIDSVGQRNGEAVTVVGEVRRQVPLVAQQLYQLQDSTGSVWVAAADDSTVTVGDRVTINGTVIYKDIQINGANLSEYYIQADRLQAESSIDD